MPASACCNHMASAPVASRAVPRGFPLTSAIEVQGEVSRVGAEKLRIQAATLSDNFPAAITRVNAAINNHLH